MRVMQMWKGVFSPSVLDFGHSLADAGFDLFCKFRIVNHEFLYSLTSLGKLGVIVGEPGTGLLDDVEFYSEVYDFSASGDSFAEDNVKFCLLERRGHLVLHHLHLYVVAKGVFTVLYLGCAADVKAH